MADDQKNIDTRRQNQLLDAQYNLLEQLNRQAQERVVFEGQVSDEIQQENEFLRQNLAERNKIEKGTVKRLTQQRELNKAASQNLGIARSIQNVTANELGTKQLIEKIDRDRQKVLGNIKFLEKQSLQIQQQNATLYKQYQKAKEKGDKERANSLKNQIGVNKAIIDSLDNQANLGKDLVEELKEVGDVSEGIANNGFLKMFNGLRDVVNLIPGLRELLPGFDQAATSFRQALTVGGGSLKEIKRRNEILRGTGKGFDKKFIEKLPEDMQSKLIDKDGKQLTGAAAAEKAKKLGLQLTTPLKAAFTALQKFLKKFLLLQFVASILKADKAAGDFAKSMNISYQESLSMQTSMVNLANSSGSIFVNSKALMETQMAINKELGTSAMLTDEQLTTMTKLREAAGFTNEELAGIAKISITTGKEAEKITGEVLAQAKISATRLGVVVNERDIVKDIAKVSSATTLSLGKSAEAIADAVTTAKALGMELSKVEAIAGSILQFESSIEDELSAELLIGKELNLDRARFAALNNDVATVAKEISSQIGTAAEFGKMNRIQQESLAKAVGMNREELAQTLYVQEQLAGVSGEEAKRREKILNDRIAEVGLAQAQQEMAEEGFETLENQASVQDRILAITDKLSESFAAMAPLILSLVDTFMLFMSPITFIFKIVGKIGKGLESFGSYIGNLVGSLGILGKILGFIAKLTVAIAAYSAYASLASIPVVGVPLGIAAAAAVTTAGMSLINGLSKADDLMSPPTAGSGYGDRILVSKEGTYALNNRDTIQASTVNSSPQSQPVVETKLYIDNEAFAQASSKSFSKL